MSSVTFIGTGNMTRLLGERAVAGGNAVEVVGRDQAKAKALAAALGDGVTAGTFAAVPAGDIVILSVPSASAVAVVSRYGDALAGKVIVDMANPFNSSATNLTTQGGISIAEEVAKAAPVSAHVVKAFNTIFGGVLAQGGRLDAFFAGGDARAKAGMSAFITSLGLRPLDVGDLSMAHWLEGAGLLMMGLARYGVGNYGFSLGVNLPD